MSVNRRVLLVAAMAAPFASRVPAHAQTEGETESTIDVEFWDTPDTDMPTGLGYGMGGDMSAATMGIKASANEVPAGEIHFNGVNTSSDNVHEMVVAPLAEGETELPYDADLQRVDEDAANSIGEISELEPGEKGEVTLHLQPGRYILYCNIPGHYAAGMWTLLTVA